MISANILKNNQKRKKREKKGKILRINRFVANLIFLSSNLKSYFFILILILFCSRINDSNVNIEKSLLTHTNLVYTFIMSLKNTYYLHDKENQIENWYLAKFQKVIFRSSLVFL